MGGLSRSNKPIDVQVQRGRAPEHWDEIVLSFPGASVFQTSSWGAFYSDYLVGEPVYLLARDAKGTPSGALLLVRLAYRHLTWFERPLGAAIIRALRPFAAHLSWLRGPLLAEESSASEVADALLARVEALTRASPVAWVLEGTPPIHAAGGYGRTLDALLKSRAYELSEEATVLIDLTSDEDQLWRGLKPSARKAVRHARAAGTVARRVEDPGALRRYEALVRTVRAHQGLRTFSSRNLTVMWHCLGAARMAVFLAEHEGTAVGGLGVWGFGDAAVEFASVQSKEAVARRLFAADLLKWEAILWARSRGFRFFDLAGVSLRPASAREAGIRQFKEKWGGQLVRSMRYRRRSGLLELLRRAIRKTRRHS